VLYCFKDSAVGINPGDNGTVHRFLLILRSTCNTFLPSRKISHANRHSFCRDKSDETTEGESSDINENLQPFEVLDKNSR